MRAAALALLALTGAAHAEGVTVHEVALFVSGAAELPAPPPWAQRRATRVMRGAEVLSEGQLPEAGPEVGAARPDPDLRARTPVQAFVFVSAADDSTLELTARYPDGQPLAWAPAAQVVGEEAVLAWSGTVTAGRTRLPRVDRDHFWSTLRRHAPGAFAGGGRTSKPDGAERFLYHQGLTLLDPPFTVERRPPSQTTLLVRAAGMERSLWVMLDGRARRVRLPGDTSELLIDLGATSGMELPAFRRDLERALGERGLSQAEARAALDVWQGILLSRGTRAISLLPRALLDRTLPLTAAPAPAELVRVALLVQDL